MGRTGKEHKPHQPEQNLFPILLCQSQSRQSQSQNYEEKNSGWNTSLTSLSKERNFELSKLGKPGGPILDDFSEILQRSFPIKRSFTDFSMAV